MTNIIIMSFVINRFITSIKFVDTNQLLFYLYIILKFCLIIQNGFLRKVS